MELRNLKGTTDFKPEEQRIRQGIIRKLQDVFEKYGYQPLETPILYYFDILSSKYAGGAEILKEVYKLTDQGEREIGLRYDLTVPFAKFIGMNPELRMPFKRYEIGKVFRNGPVKTGRSREFIQCDADMVGVKSMMAEADLLMMAVDAYRLLGLDIYISYNNRKLLSGIIELTGIAPELSGKVILCIDKLEKIGKEAVKSEILQLGVVEEQIDYLFNVMGMTLSDIRELVGSKQSNDLIRQGIEEITELNSYFEDSDIKGSLRFNPALARGLEIYTGTVWEVFLRDGTITSSVGAGGRYDNIIGRLLGSGTECPAVGMTFGLDVIYQALLIKGTPFLNSMADLYIIPLGTNSFAVRLARKLRNQGIKVDVEMTGRKLRKSLDYANKQGIKFVVILGENELNSGTVKLKDMINSCECDVPIEDLGRVLSLQKHRPCI